MPSSRAIPEPMAMPLREAGDVAEALLGWATRGIAGEVLGRDAEHLDARGAALIRGHNLPLHQGRGSGHAGDVRHAGGERGGVLISRAEPASVTPVRHRAVTWAFAPRIVSTNSSRKPDGTASMATRRRGTR